MGASAAGAWLLIQRATHLGLIDHPGQRRMHAIPTPRGGGVGMVVALVAIVLLAIPAGLLKAPVAIPLAAMLALLAIVGFLDDRGSLPILPRLLAHVLAGLVIAWVLRREVPMLPIAAIPLLAFMAAAATNFANFLDGVNGLLSLQVAFVMLALVVLLPMQSPLWPIALAGGLAVLAFLPFNFPRARCFMGDAASGTLGFFTAVLLLFAVLRGELAPPALLLLPSGILLDTSLTLLSRMLRGKRFWRAHREHLYQWLVRRGWSVTRVNALWLSWNAATLALLLLQQEVAGVDPLGSTLVLLGSGGVVWWIAKRSLVRSRKRSG